MHTSASDLIATTAANLRATVLSRQEAEVEALRASLRFLEAEWERSREMHNRRLQDRHGNDVWFADLQSAQAERETRMNLERTKIEGDLSALNALTSKALMMVEDASATLATFFGIVDQLRPVLERKRRQLEYRDEYGVMRQEGWLREVSKLITTHPQMCSCLTDLTDLSDEIHQAWEWKEQLINLVDRSIFCSERVGQETLGQGDGIGFERDCAKQLEALGWSTSTTPMTGDQGVDIIAQRSNIRVAIQCKYVERPIGNSAVQEAYSGKAFYEAHHAVVLSNNGFTPAAQQLAARTGVLLLDVKAIEELNKLAV